MPGDDNVLACSEATRVQDVVGALLILLFVAPAAFRRADTDAPEPARTLKFAVLGDNGSGDSGQYELATQIAAVHRLFAFGFVVMVGDNFYGTQTPAELSSKFDVPYRPLLDSGVTFHAAIGNHDEPFTVNYPPLTWVAGGTTPYVRQQVRFLVLDTNIMDGRNCAGSSQSCSNRRSRGRSRISIIRSMATRNATARRWTSGSARTAARASTVSLSSSRATITSTNG